MTPMVSKVAYILNKQKLRRVYRQVKKLRRRTRALGRWGKNFRSAFMPGSSESQWLFGEDYTKAGPDQKLIRQAMRYYGPGDYRSILKYGSRGIGALAGGAMGYMRGGLAGAGAGVSSGWDQGANFSKYMGWGDYRGVSTNQIMGGGDSNQQQISVNQTDLSGDIYVTRTEFVSNLVVTGTAGGSSPFENRTFSLNPGISQSFPWLSQISNCFTLYDFEGLMFQYKPLFSEDAGNSNNLGKVIMATDYDPTAPAFVTSVQMENYDYANSTKPSCGMVHGVETANRQQVVNMMYVRTGAVSRDLTFYDIGTFQVATEGIPLPAASTTQIIGEIWVTYRLKLSRAEIYSSLLGNNISCDAQRGTSSAAALTTGTTFSKASNNIGVVVTNQSATSLRITFPVNITLGYYQIVMYFASGATPFTTQNWQVPTNFVNCQYYLPGYTIPGGSLQVINGPASPVGTTSQTGMMQMFYVYVNSPGLTQARVDINVSAALSATTTWSLFVQQSCQAASLSIN